MKKAKPFIIVGFIVIVLVTVYFIFFKDKKEADPLAAKVASPGKDQPKNTGIAPPSIDPDYITDRTKGLPVIPGQKGENVKTIQKALNWFWKAGLPVTGTWAAQTTIAITKAGYPLKLYAKDIISLNAGKKYQK